MESDKSAFKFGDVDIVLVRDAPRTKMTHLHPYDFHNL